MVSYSSLGTIQLRQRQAGLGSRSERLTDHTASALRERRVTGSVLS